MSLAVASLGRPGGGDGGDGGDMNILVVGGAGYIGSHMVKFLHRAGHDTVTFDNLSNGHADAVLHGTLIEGELSDRRRLDEVFSSYRFDAVMHFASLIQVGESMREPARYYANNLAATLNLLEAMRESGCNNLVFSSSAAVYGKPLTAAVSEDQLPSPINPYGRTKWMAEQMMRDFAAAYGLRYAALRYFNAAGADPEGELGERHDPETHLIPLVLAASLGRLENIAVLGTDYPTPDGTCLRDYIHVWDLARAHLLAVERLIAHGECLTLNLGNGDGYSVRQVIAVVRRVTGREIPVTESPRRAGDPPVLVADARLAGELLGWRPEYPALEEIIAHAWRWESSRVGMA